MPDQGLIATRDTESLRSILGGRIDRGFLTNLDNGRENPFLFNPSELREKYRANYARHGAPGLSYERLQFLGNPNTLIPLTLVFDQVVFNERKGGTGAAPGGGIVAENDVLAYRQRLLELIYPRRGQRLATASPTSVLFVWPGMISMRVKIIELEFRHVEFQARRPIPRIMVAQVNMEEDVESRIFSEDMALHGTLRPWASSQRTRR